MVVERRGNHIGLTDTQTTDSEAAYETLPQAIFQFLPILIPDQAEPIFPDRSLALRNLRFESHEAMLLSRTWLPTRCCGLDVYFEFERGDMAVLQVAITAEMTLDASAGDPPSRTCSTRLRDPPIGATPGRKARGKVDRSRPPSSEPHLGTICPARRLQLHR